MRTAASAIILTTALLGCVSNTPSSEAVEVNPDASNRNLQPTASTQETRISGTSHHELRSDIIGQNFTIDVALPLNAGPGPYPVIYLTDADMFFPMVVTTMRLLEIGKEIPPAILVGIGYVNSSEQQSLRFRDLTPTIDSSYFQNNAAQQPPPAKTKTGGADNFLDFIATKVKPFIEQNYPASSEDTTLMGDSLGGLFALHTMFTRPAEFSRYVAGSPSIWWGESVLFETEQQYAKDHQDLAARAFVSIGGLEQPDSEIGARFQMVTNMHTMTERLAARNYPSLNLRKVEFEGETHLSVIPATFSRGLREIFEN